MGLMRLGQWGWYSGYLPIGRLQIQFSFPPGDILCQRHKSPILLPFDFQYLAWTLASISVVISTLRHVQGH